MNKKSVLLSLSLCIFTYFLLRYFNKQISWQTVIDQIKYIRWKWVGYSMLANILTHVVRAYRWQLLINPHGYKVSLIRLFLAEKVGLFVNLFLPRLGDIVRCSTLKTLSPVPLNHALGTVVIERGLDMLCFVFLGFISSFFLPDQVRSFLYLQTLGKFHNNNWIFTSAILLAVLLFISWIVYFYAPARLEKLKQISRRHLTSFLQGLQSIRYITHPFLFFLATGIIWILTFLIGYLFFYALPSTSTLSFTAGLAILFVSLLGLASPVQGGIGVYHFLVQTTLIAYGLSEQEAMVYAVFTHLAQLLITLVVGGSCSIIALLLGNR